MQLKFTIRMTLMALAPVVGGFIVLRSQPKSAPSMEPPKVSHRKVHDRRAPSPAERPTLAALPIAPWQPEAGIDGLSVESQERLQTICQRGVALKDIPEALRFLQSLPEQPGFRDLMFALIRQWAESDAPSAAHWAEGMPIGAIRQESLNGVALVWANQDLDGTIQWATQLPADDERTEVLRGTAYEAARTEPLTALSIAVESPASPENDALIQHSALQWASKSPEEAARWAVDISDQALRERVLSLVAAAWGESDPVAASKLAISAIAPGKAQDDAVIGIVQRWVQTDPDATQEWVQSFPKGVLRETAIANIIQLRREKTQ
jgi:hypothetical protein